MRELLKITQKWNKNGIRKKTALSRVSRSINEWFSWRTFMLCSAFELKIFCTPPNIMCGEAVLLLIFTLFSAVLCMRCYKFHRAFITWHISELYKSSLLLCYFYSFFQHHEKRDILERTRESLIKLFFDKVEAFLRLLTAAEKGEGIEAIKGIFRYIYWVKIKQRSQHFKGLRKNVHKK